MGGFGSGVTGIFCCWCCSCGCSVSVNEKGLCFFCERNSAFLLLVVWQLVAKERKTVRVILPRVPLA